MKRLPGTVWYIVFGSRQKQGKRLRGELLERETVEGDRIPKLPKLERPAAKASTATPSKFESESN